MAVCGNEDSLIGFLWINPLRRVQGVKLPETQAHTHTHTQRLTITTRASNETVCVCVLCSIKQNSIGRVEY